MSKKTFFTILLILLIVTIIALICAPVDGSGEVFNARAYI